MSSIIKKDIQEHYNIHSHNSEDYFAKNINDLIDELKQTSEPLSFLQHYIAMTQLFFDGLISRKCESEEPGEKQAEWKDQKQALENIYLNGRKTIGSFYKGEGIPFDKVKTFLSEYMPEITAYSDSKYAKGQHLDKPASKSRIQKFGQMLNKLKQHGFDSLICIASGGFEPAFLAMHVLDNDSLTSVRYSRMSKYDSKVKIPANAPANYLSQTVENKKVLLIEDFPCTGTTLVNVVSKLIQHNPSELYIATVDNRLGSLNSAQRTLKNILPLDLIHFKERQPMLARVKK